MLLRARISFFVTIAFAIVSVSILYATTKREELAQIEHAKESIYDQANLWEKVKSELIQRMADGTNLLTENEDFLIAIAFDQIDALQEVAADVVDQLSDEAIADRLDVYGHEGELLYSSQVAVFQSSVVGESVALNAIEFDIEISGVGNDKERNTAIVYAFPLHLNDELIGLAVYSADIVEALLEMENLTQSWVSVVNRRGRMLASRDAEQWNDFQQYIKLNEFGVLQSFTSTDRFYTAAVLPQIAELGGLVGRLVIVQDVTNLTQQQRRIKQITIISIAIFLVFVLIGLNLYMSRTFSPLAEGVRVLNALSEGDLSTQIQHHHTRDEVGTIVEAVDRFRINLLALTRLRRSRERQRSRQERFIQKQMLNLAETLDGEARVAVLEELNQLDEIIQSSARSTKRRGGVVEQEHSLDTSQTRRDSDTMSLIATAFQRMSARVLDQHQKLREAIVTREALAALRQELDIATRVQLSLLPRHIEVSDSFDIAGSMVAAKEVGGDFYDYFRLDESHVGVSVADVSGKGVASALFMAMARTLLRSNMNRFQSPATVLATMNEFLEQNNDEQLFVTMLYGVLDESNGDFTYSVAGHDPPILKDSSQVRTLERTNDMLLGMFSGLDYHDRTVRLEHGSRLVFFTDGVTEAFNAADEQFGTDRLADVVATLSGESPQDDVAAITKAVDNFVGDAEPFDDITCVVMFYKDPNQRSKN